CTRVEIENHAGDGSRDRKATGIYAPLAPATVSSMLRLRQEAILVCLGREVPAGQRRRSFFRSNGAPGEIHFCWWKCLERSVGKAKILGQELLGSMTDPVRYAERAELR